MTYKGEIDTKTANSITATCNVILSGIRVDDQEKKIAEIAAQIAARKNAALL